MHYHGTPPRHSYECLRLRGNYGGPSCQRLSGPCLDAFVSQQVLAALEPAALELSLSAAQQVEQERAARQYHAVEPENRLVARARERAWEEKLVAQQQLEEEYHRFACQQPRVLTEAEREVIRQLATDIPALWVAPTTTAADRQEIVRQVVERVEVAVQGKSEQVRVHISWAGGGQTAGVITRPIARLADRSDYRQLCERVRDLTAAGWTASAIADQLDGEGYPAPRTGHRWSSHSVLTLRRQAGLSGPRRRGASREGLGPDEWWTAELAGVLPMPRSCLFNWIRRGWVRARQEGHGLHRWIVWADAAELDRLRWTTTQGS